MEHHYDIIIIGAGAAGLLLADALGSDPFFSDHSILLLDKDSKELNDRTWCFWEKGDGDLDHLLYASWNKLRFRTANLTSDQSIAPYRYKMVRGIDFYKEYLQRIQGYDNIHFLQRRVQNMVDKDSEVTVETDGETFYARQVFNSIFSIAALKKQQNYPLLQQHFRGWFVKTDIAVFDQSTVTFMDFSIPQKDNTRFMYILPFSETEALVEYTLFSKELLPPEEYQSALASYMEERYPGTAYEVTEREAGKIPMSCAGIEGSASICPIGLAGGWAKPSTGFTFMNSRRNVLKLIQALKAGHNPAQAIRRGRHWFYDLIFLDVLSRHNEKGSAIFGSLFNSVPATSLLAFLDETSSIPEEFRIIRACPRNDFIKAFGNRVRSYLTGRSNQHA